MDHTYDSSTVVMDDTGFDSLKHQILNRNEKSESQDIREKSPEPTQTKAPSSKKFVFQRGDESLELDDDFELEIMADKRPTRLTLRELKDRAAGDIAVKNRMHSLAEEKKRVQATFKDFANLAKEDPLAALEFISNKAREADSEFEYQKYIEKLADQAEKLGQMDEKDRKSYELEKELNKAKQDLSLKERQDAVVQRKHEILSNYTEIGDRQFGEMVDAILSNEDLLDGIEDEHDIMDKVEELIQETLTQRDIMTVIREINPSEVNNDKLIFSLSDQLRQNPDLDEEDVRDIVRELIGTKERSKSPSSERDKDIRTLSNKARQSTPSNVLRTQNADPYDVLKQQLLDRKEELSKTPLYKR